MPHWQLNWRRNSHENDKAQSLDDDDLAGHHFAVCAHNRKRPDLLSDSRVQRGCRWRLAPVRFNDGSRRKPLWHDRFWREHQPDLRAVCLEWLRGHLQTDETWLTLDNIAAV